MKAVRIHEFGGPEVLELEEAPIPQPAEDDALVKVYATSINPVDWKIREGARREKFPVNLPLIPGWDVSGVIEKVGEHVHRFKPGDEVYGRPDPTKNGAYAEYIVVKANQLGFKPKSTDHINAAAVPLAGLTAWQGLFDHGHLEKGQKVLIHAASGGVGTFAVQFAKWKGAYVIGTASEENLSFIKQLGADEPIDYKNESFDDLLSDIDLVFDTIGGDTQKRSVKVLKNGGRLITTLKPEFQAEAKEKHIYLGGYTAQSYPDQLEQIAGLIDEGIIQPVVSMVLSLDDARKGQQISEQGHVRGKIVIKVV
ncbi:MAG TPA: NADP-dependent oxidoreductase [Mucilaginibacter sp.]|jgi:NADPH:quinone reductase-like Zn-dependent oxidoreductase|nr:NADP-dependent oxidoreductase [Mucilaginibacter sp.]